MRTGPTIFSPWFVVQKYSEPETPTKVFYYQASEDVSESSFTEKPELALLFTNLQSAARVAQTENAQIRVIVSKADVEEFRPN